MRGVSSFDTPRFLSIVCDLIQSPCQWRILRGKRSLLRSLETGGLNPLKNILVRGSVIDKEDMFR